MKDFFPWMVHAAGLHSAQAPTWRVAIRLDTHGWQWRTPWHRAGRARFAFTRFGKGVWFTTLVALAFSGMAVGVVSALFMGEGWRVASWASVWFSIGLGCAGWALWVWVAGRVSRPGAAHVWHAIPLSVDALERTQGRLEYTMSEEGREVLADAVDCAARLGHDSVGGAALIAACAARPVAMAWMADAGLKEEQIRSWVKREFEAMNTGEQVGGWHAQTQAALAGAGLCASAHGSARVDVADVFIATCAAGDAFSLGPISSDMPWHVLAEIARESRYPQGGVYPFAVRRAYDRTPLV